MIEVKEPQRPQPNPKILIIEENDELPKNKHYFKGKRFDHVFIHKDNKYKEDFKVILEPNISLLNYNFGQFYEYE